MERQVILCINGDEYDIGHVGALYKGVLVNIINDIVDEIAYGDGASDYVVCSIEVR